MNMINVIVNFRRYLKRRNYSPHTLKYYLSVIKQFVLWLNVPFGLVDWAGAACIVATIFILNVTPTHAPDTVIKPSPQ